MTEDARPAPTPKSSWLGLVLMAFAVGSPFLGGFIQDHTPGAQKQTLGIFFGWLLVGAAAGALGVICTVIGAVQRPRSAITAVAIAVAILLVIAVVAFSVLLFR